MNTLLLLRQRLRDTERLYIEAKSSLDSEGSVSLLLAKQALKDIRAEYAEACVEFVEECICSEAVLQSDEAKLVFKVNKDD